MNYKIGDTLMAKKDLRSYNLTIVFLVGKLYTIKDIQDNGCCVFDDENGITRSITLVAMDNIFTISPSSAYDDAMSILE